MRISTIVSLIFLTFLLSTTIMEVRIISSAQPDALKYNVKTVGYDVKEAIANFNYTDIKLHVKKFSSFGSRVTGYPENLKAAEYIYDEFKRYGLNVTVQKYTIPVPIDSGSWIEIISPVSKKIRAYSLWPNGVQACTTPSEGISGRLIYVGDGNLSRINGYDIEGTIALIDFNSGMNWVNLANLGVKAFIFIEPNETSSFEALKKAVPTPINFPRLYVNQKDGMILKNIAANNGVVTVHNEMRWENREALNIIGIIEGENPNDVIVISSRYDSWSIVPSISPGAEDALGISSLLEVARYFAEPDNKPLRTLWFVAFSGHYQGLQGPYEWAEKTLFSDEVQRGKIRILLQIDLDFSTETNGLDVLYTGPPIFFGDQSQFSSRYYPLETDMGNFVSEFLEEDKSIVRFNFASMRWGTQQVIRDTDWSYQLNVQPIIQCGPLGFTLRTQYARRLTWFTPLNGYRYINWNNFKPQFLIAKTIIEGFANKQSWTADYMTPMRFSYVTTAGLVTLGFVPLKGTVAEFNITKGWYDPTPKALVRMYPAGADPNAYLLWPFKSRYTFTSSNGTFTFYGLVPLLDHYFDAWKFSDKDGSITYTSDLGLYGAAAGATGGIRLVANPTTSTVQVLIPVFNCTEITVFDLINVRMMREAQVPYTGTSARFQVYEIKRRSVPIFYNIYYAPAYGIGMAFVKRGTKVSLSFNPTPGETGPLILLTNSTKENPEGYGFYIDKPMVIHRTLYQAVNDMYYICESRYSVLSERNVKNSGVETLLKEITSYKDRMESTFRNHIYDKGYAYSIVALTLVGRLYDSGVMPLINETSYFILFFSIPCILFAVLFERLVLHRRGLKRIIGITAILIVTLTILAFINPALTLMANSYLSILAIGLLLIGAFIVGIFLSESLEIMERFSAEKMGMHLFKTEKVASMMHSMTVSVDNLRRRPLITVPTLLTIILFTAALTSFSSPSRDITVKEGALPSLGSYDGLLLKRFYGYPPDSNGGILGSPALKYLEAFTDEKFAVSPRIWLYPISTYPYGVSESIISPEGVPHQVQPLVYLGLSLEEMKLLFGNYVTGAILDSPNTCLIFEDLAKVLNVKPGDHIYVKGLGLNLTVTGIITYSSEEILTDLDGSSIFPIDPYYSQEISKTTIPYVGEEEPISVGTNNVIIIPWKTAYDQGGFISNVALIAKNNVTEEEIKDIGKTIAMGLEVGVYAKYEDSRFSFTRVFMYSFGGWNIVLILLAISLTAIVNTLIGSVQQRRRDIHVYASLGLSPLGAFMMFIIESLVYAVIAAVIGYLLGYTFNLMLLILIGGEGTISYNISSFFVLISMTAVMVTCIGAAIYPSMLASKMITPSLERRWKPPTKPHGDQWSIPIPFRILTETEARGVLRYLHEYFSELGSIRPGFRILQLSDIDYKNMEILLRVNLTPTELGINQKVTIKEIPQQDNTFLFNVLIQRETGDYDQWRIRNYYFVDDLRKQLLIWRSLPPEEKEKYFA